jgi:adenine-specific DNA-methyltransferase
MSEDVEAPNHILIEGDNLHALTALTFTHKDKIDVIYIDPPYNTGNKDFIYNDKYVDREDSYRHSKWLSFMEKRLRLAHELLNETGVIFLSIDDNENAQLKLLCDEIFNSKNFIRDIIWQSRKSVSNDAFISMNHNYTLFYAKNSQVLDKNNFKLPINASNFSNVDNDPRGKWKADPFDAPGIRPNLTYAIKNPNTGQEYWPPKGRCWRVAESDYLEFLKDNRILFGKTGRSKPQLKRFLDFATNKGATAISVWNDIDTTTNGTKQLMEVLNNNMFNNPKPLGLLRRILQLSTSNNKSALVLDFFAGSGTTLHSTLELNKEDDGKRQCILVTNNENNIAEEVTYERNKRVIEGYKNLKGEEVEGLTANNLRYFQTDFVPSVSNEKNRRLLTERSTELICIKEDCYIDITAQHKNIQPHLSRIFTNQKGNYLVVIYHSFVQFEVIQELIKIIPTLGTDEKVKVYSFSPEKETIDEEFLPIIDMIDSVPLPESIYNTYKQCFKSIKLDRKPVVEPEKTDDNVLFI